MKNGPVKFETNVEKTKVFDNHIISCFTPLEDNDDKIEKHIEFADKTSNENINEPNSRSTSTSPIKIQQIINKLTIKKCPGHELIINKILKILHL